jgi:activator of HSP90 ATPase
MTTTLIEQSASIPCAAQTLFDAWLDSKTHAAMVEGTADINPAVGGEYSIWDGGITGKTLAIDDTALQIMQTWRYDYDGWPKDKPSILTVQFVPDGDNACKITLKQESVPAQYADDINDGWKEFYWDRMQKYFAKPA